MIITIKDGPHKNRTFHFINYVPEQLVMPYFHEYCFKIDQLVYDIIKTKATLSTKNKSCKDCNRNKKTNESNKTLILKIPHNCDCEYCGY